MNYWEDKDITKTGGYRKWLEVGRKIRSTENHYFSDIPNMTDQELNDRKIKGETWLKDSQNHPQYKVFLKRYEAICDEILQREDIRTLKEAREALI